jgi:hypothetical protein
MTRVIYPESVADNGEGNCLVCGKRIRLNEIIVRNLVSGIVDGATHRYCLNTGDGAKGGK